MSSESAKRPYRKRRRAEAEARTRRRITEAAVELHGTVGPARTTISGVADRAGVQRATVYRHFPTEEDLFAACSAHWYSLRPPPDPAEWTRVADPSERLRTALADLFAWYEWAEPMLSNTFRDAPLVPAMRAAEDDYAVIFEAMIATLLRGRNARGARRRLLAAAIGHALSFETWRSLRRDGDLDEAEAIALLEATVAAAARR